MANMQRITSFKTFSELKKQEGAMKLREENNSKRGELINSISATLEELGITSLTELTEEERAKFIAKLFNEDRAEDIEADIVDMGEPEDAEDGEDLEANEGNKFIYAAAKARQEGKEEFEFNGKKYKVTLKKDTGLKESYTVLITEGTRGFFGKIDKAGNISAVYTHYDSYPENMLPIIKKSYKDSKAVDAVIAKGDNSGLEADIEKMNFYNDKNSMKPLKGKKDSFSKFQKDAMNSGAEFIYLYDEADRKWYMVDTYADKALKPAFESVEVEEAFLDEGAHGMAKKLLQSLIDGETSRVEGIKMSKEMAEHLLNWINTSPFGKKNEKLPLEMLIKASFSWGIERGLPSNLKSELADLKSVVKESVEINEADINSDEEFKEYAMSVLKKAFGDDFDEAKATEVVDGILGKVDGDYGAAVGMLTSSLGESTVTEGFDAKYWEDYHEGSQKITSVSKVARAVEDAVEDWNDNNEDGKDNEVSKNGEKKVMNLAHDFFKSTGWISKDVIDAMIAQES